jgi:MFS family permease
MRWWPSVLAWALWLASLLCLAAVPWLDELLRQAGRADLVQFDPDVAVPVLALVSSATVGAVVAARRPAHPVGWLLLGIALSLTGTAATAQYFVYGLLVRPGALPAARYAVLYQPATGFTALALIGFVLLLTPTGSLPSPRWRWPARVMAATPAVLVLVVTLAGGPVDPRYQALGGPFDLRGLDGVLLAANRTALAVTVVGLVAAAVSLVGRFRHARGVERLQLRWVALAAVLVGLGAVGVLFSLAVGGSAAGTLFDLAVGCCLVVPPVATGAAVLRYRLYDLDRIVSRTLSYGLLTLLLGGGYALVVLGLGQLLGRDSSSLVVAAATLAVAAAFQPARRRVQRLVDRRFNRRRYDAARTVDAFAARLREQVDLDALSAELLAVVDQTMQPTMASLWLRPQPPAGAAEAIVARQRT